MIDLSEIEHVSKGLKRPECVLSTQNGRLFTADWRGGVGVTEADGSQWVLLPSDPDLSLRPNGICLLPDNSVLITHLGDEDGGVYRLAEDGATTAFCLAADGVTLPPSNYVHLDQTGRIWVTVSTRKIPRAGGYQKSVSDGFMVLIEHGHARIVADGLTFANECIVHPDGRRIYVNETFGRRLVSFDIAQNGDLSNKTTITEFGHGVFPDGLTFDCEGGVWVTSIISNRVIRVAPDGTQEVMIEDSDPAHLDWVEAAYEKDEMARPHLDTAAGKILKNISSLAFGGADLKTAYLGCLLDESIYRFKSPIAGHAPTHWNFEGPRRV